MLRCWERKGVAAPFLSSQIVGWRIRGLKGVQGAFFAMFSPVERACVVLGSVFPPSPGRLWPVVFAFVPRGAQGKQQGNCNQATSPRSRCSANDGNSDRAPARAACR